MRKRTLLVVAAIGLVAVCTESSNVSGVPRPEANGKSYVFPAGRFILAGGPEAAVGDDDMEIKDDFRLKPGQFILSGGPNPTDAIVVDDDLEVRQGEKLLFIDNDKVASTDNRGKAPATYQGHPIILRLDPKVELKITGIDHFGSDAILSPLWLHRHDGAKRELAKGVKQASAPNLPAVFFDEEFDLTKDFATPEKIRMGSGSVIDIPERPATLLPKNKK